MPVPDVAGLTLKKVVDWSGAACEATRVLLSQKVRGLNNDSRTISRGEVFVALTTEKDDGHRYVTDALARGAAAALVSKTKTGMFPDAVKGRLVAVADPLKALHRIASNYRTALGIPVIGITGSSGKTTGRNFIAGVLRQSLKVGETAGNLNNHIGVPVSLLRFTGAEEVGVLEMGANHVREIHLLSMTARPTIGVVTNIGYAHIGYFGSLANIAKAKLEIIDGMDRNTGIVMLNGDDRLLVRGAARVPMKVVFFGFSARCRIRAQNERLEDGGTRFEVDGSEYRLSMPGRHFIYSALPAIYLGRYFGVDERGIARALAGMRPVSMRGTIEKKSGVTFIVDCYNANPSSMKSAISLLSDVAGKRNKVAIVGDMLELGKYSRRLHLNLGEQLAKAGVARLLAVGEFATVVADGAVRAGMRAGRIAVAANSEEALERAQTLVRPDDVVLLKGSRGVHLETVFNGF